MSGLVLLLAITVKPTGTIVLPAGETVISKPVQLPDGAHDLDLRGDKTTLRMSDDFRGAGAIVCRKCKNVTVRDFTITGGTSAVAAIAPYDRAFVDYYGSNGIVFIEGEHIRIQNIELRRIPNFAILISASRNVGVQNTTIMDSGSLQANGRNNTTGGILLEEGTSVFNIEKCTFRNIRGNAVWTHSRYTSPRNGGGMIEYNTFDTIGRDAIQVGHATTVFVGFNTGRKIGYPGEIVDPNGMPVAIDTAGNVDKSHYNGNKFEDVNGKCIDLDGFHDGGVNGNECRNVANYGIVFNNTNPDMQSCNVLVTSNTIEDVKYGGIFLIGEGHTVTKNKLLRLNQAHCNEAANCIYIADEPDMLRSGIYFGRKAERPDPAKNNVVRDNEISGYGMDQHCFGYAPGITSRDQKMEGNTCKP